LRKEIALHLNFVDRPRLFYVKCTLREESVCGRKLCGSAEPQIFYVFAEKTFAVGSFKSILRNKLLQLRIFKRYFFRRFLQIMQQ